VHEAMAHPLILGFLNKVETEEIIPYVPPVPDTNIADYYKLIVQRFSNPEVADTERRLCLDGSNRQPKFIIPSLRDALSANGKIDGLALVSALWCRYCYGTTDSGVEIAPNDPNWDYLQAQAKAAKEAPVVWLQMKPIYGDLNKDVRFVAAFTKALNALWAKGTAAVLRDYIG
jgi:mannitol 2-dehydrogenase